MAKLNVLICAAIAFVLASAIMVHQLRAFPTIAELGVSSFSIECCSDIALVLCALGLLLLAWELQKAAAVVGSVVAAFGIAILVMQLLDLNAMGVGLLSSIGGASQTFPRHRIPLSAGILSFLVGACLVAQSKTFRIKQRSVVIVALALPIVIIGLLSAFAFVISWSKGEVERLFFLTPFRSAVACSSEFIVLGIGLLCVAWERRPTEEVGARELGRSIVLYSSAAVFVVSIVGSLFAVLPFYDRLRDVFDQNVLEGMKNNALSGEEFLSMLRNDLAHVGTRISNFSLPSNTSSAGGSVAGTQVSPAKINAPLESDSYVLGIVQVNRKGAVQRSVGEEIPKELWPSDTLANSELYVHGPFELHRRLVLVVSVPSVEKSGDETRDLVLINGHVLEEIFHNYREQNPLGHLYLGSNVGNSLSLFAYQDATGRLVPSPDSPPGVVSFFHRSLPRSAGLLMPDDLLPQPLLTAFAPLRGSDLGMSISVPLRELYADTAHELVNLIIGALLFAGLSAGGIFLLIRGLVRHTELLQSQVKKSLSEKDLLLQEVHHRVKNNLQIIMSLLRLQSRNLRDQSALAVFEESQNRIESISLLHELSYGSVHAVKIGAGQYIEKLSRRLISSYDLKSNYLIELKGDEVQLDLDTAVPFALLMNELLTHAIKCHLEDDGSSGRMDITLSHENAECSVSMFDTDQKFFNALDIAGPVTFSARLIGNLLKQLKGTLEILPLEDDGATDKKGMTLSFLNNANAVERQNGTVAHTNS